MRALQIGLGLLLAGGLVHAQATAVGPRRIALEGAANFRDLGGYATADGKHVRWGKVYRSGELSRLTAADYQKLAGLGIAVVCDFRRESERRAAPSSWPGANAPAMLSLPGAQTERTAGAAPERPAAAPVPSGLSPLLVGSYPEYVKTLTSSFRTVLQHLMTAQGAVLYHCTAGKDRTGSFSALLLTLLGVPRDVVMQDYLLSNEYVATASRIDAFVARGGSRDSAVAMIGVDRAYLEMFFTSIDAEYGSFDEYRRRGLELSDADLSALKAKLLE